LVPIAVAIPLYPDTPPPQRYTLSLHDALPIFFLETHEQISFFQTQLLDQCTGSGLLITWTATMGKDEIIALLRQFMDGAHHGQRSEEHTSELQSRENLVCRLLLEKKNALTQQP